MRRRMMNLLVILVACIVFGATSTTVMAEVRTEKADIAIVGAGSAGLAAAVTAAERGAKVVILEKMPFPGGSSNFAEGMFAVESNLQKKKYIDVSKDEAFKKHMENAKWRLNASLVRAIIDKSADTIDWLQKLGVEFEPAALYPGGPQTWHLVKEKGPAHHGAVVVNALTEKAKQLGVQIYFETPGKKLIFDEKKRVSGVVAQDSKGNTVQVNARAVILATGGFPNNPEMIKKYTGHAPNELFAAIPLNKTGDGINMAIEAGASIDGMMGMMALPGLIGPGVKPFSHLFAVTAQPFLWVNQNGERFCDEGVVYKFATAGNIVLTQKNKQVYSVFDEVTKKAMMEQGTDNGSGVIIPVGTKLVNLEADIQAAITAGSPHVVTATSIEELAVKMGVDPSRLKKTVADYNRYGEKGHDDGFAKEPRYLRPVKNPKFYAVRMFPLLLITLGGVKTTGGTEVLNTSNEIIPGLYAVGNDIGGLHAEVYDVETTGGTFGFAVNSGRIAGENVLRYIGK